MTVATLTQTLPAVAARHGSTVGAGHDAPLFRIHRRYGLKLALALGDPLHPYPELIDPRFATADGLLSAVATLRSTGTDILRLRYLAQDAIPDIAELPAGAVVVQHETSIADLRRIVEPTTVNGLVRRRSRWIQLQREHGPLSFQSVEQIGPRKNLVDRMIEWKRAWFEEQGIRAHSFNDPFHLDALRTLATTGSPRSFRVHCLSAGDHPVAIEACIEHSGSLLNLIIAGHPGMRRYGPGVLLSKLALDYAAREGVESVDFLPPSSSHKEHLADRNEVKFELRVPLTLGGRLLLSAFTRVVTVKERSGAVRG